MQKLKHHKDCKLTDRRALLEAQQAVRRAPTDVPGIHFLPWVGKSYGKSRMFHGKRLLLLGESHYEWCEKCWHAHATRGADFTCRCVAQCVVGDPPIQHWNNIEYALTGEHLDQAGRAALWQSVAYYNYVQEIAGFYETGRRSSRPTPEMWESAKAAFLELLKRLSPDRIIVLGFTLWQHLPDEGPDGRLSPVNENGKTIERCFYKLDHKKTIASCVRHPAAGLGAPWHPALRKTIATA